MFFTIVLFFMGICLGELNGVPVDDIMHTLENNNNNNKPRTLYIRSVPGYPGVRSDLYEVYMEPYYQSIDTKAMVELKAYDDKGAPMDGPKGMLKIEQHPNGVRIMGTIMGLTAGMHGFHIHEKGDISQGCNSAGAHYNPFMVNHGAPADPLRHVGDLGNIEATADGTAEVDIMDHYLTLTGVRGVIGRTLVIHEKADDFGRGGSQDSMTTGSAGPRIACGIIGFA